MRIRWVAIAVLSASAAFAAPHDVAFWRDLAANDYAIPEGAALEPLVAELSEALGSTDPVLRDGVAYTTLTAWIYEQKKLDAPHLNRLVDEWSANLKRGLGESGTDSVFRRSFSALMLSTAAAYDNANSFLEAERFDRLVREALEYLAAEKDLRDYDPAKGWIHATAHTADLLKFLGRSPKLKAERQAAIAAGIQARLRSAGAVFTHGEDERLARALLSLLRRADADKALLDAWLTALPAENKALWQAPALDPAGYASVQNQRGCLRSLYAVAMADQEGRVPEALRAKILAAVMRTS